METYASINRKIIEALKNTTKLSLTLEEIKLESRFIIQHALGISQAQLIININAPVNEEEEEFILSILKRRMDQEPLPYIFREWSFYGRTFKVNPHVLIPRAETETLIEIALSKINTHDHYDILDLGCGTGIIGITIALERPLSKVILIDQSEYAIQNTKENQSLHQVTNTTIYKSDWFGELDQKRFDVILSNPPYLEENDPHLLQGLVHEPLNALVSGTCGTEAIHHIIENAKNHINPSGWLFIEHGYNQAKILKDLFEKNGYQHIENAKDIHKIIRITYGQK